MPGQTLENIGKGGGYLIRKFFFEKKYVVDPPP
jgi:hypothetical protein